MAVSNRAASQFVLFALLLWSLSRGAIGGTRTTDTDFLCTLYSTVQPAGQALLTNWCGAKNPDGQSYVNDACNTTRAWSGITCGTTGGKIRVMTIDIQQLDLSGGSLPSSTSTMDALSTLVLVGCSLSGALPTALGATSRLNYLYLDQNRFTGSIPSQINQLNFLQHFSANRNKLSGEIPSSLGNGLPSLTMLSVDDNSISGTLPGTLGQLTNLQVLNLGNNRLLTGKIPSELGGLVSLTLLALHNDAYKGGLDGSIPWPSGFSQICNNSYSMATRSPGPYPISQTSIF